MHKENWDDMRFVLAVAETGSVSAAARRLGVNHATVLRRIATFEERQGSPIFDKTPRGYIVPPERIAIIEAAREVEAAILSVERLIEGGQSPLHGVVRVTSTDTFCHSILPPILAELHAKAGDLRIDLICSNAHLDLGRLDADITVRPALHLSDELEGEQVGMLGVAVYAGAGCGDRWLGLSGALMRSRPFDWMQDHMSPDLLAGRADSFLSLREMAAAGLGRAILPRILGENDPRLQRVPTELPDLSVPVWVASHSDLANVPRILAVRAHLIKALRARSGELAGIG
jgi:DNA-binding transcriptional LysR family regulator